MRGWVGGLGAAAALVTLIRVFISLRVHVGLFWRWCGCSHLQHMWPRMCQCSTPADLWSSSPSPPLGCTAPHLAIPPFLEACVPSPTPCLSLHSSFCLHV